VALVGVLPLLPPGRIWEPAAGAGKLVKTMRAAGREVVATDQPRLDYLTDAPPAGDIAAIVTNPPFNKLDAFLTRGLEHLDAGVAASVTLCCGGTTSPRQDGQRCCAEQRRCGFAPGGRVGLLAVPQARDGPSPG
jgi:hypothetical protein